MIIDIHAHTSNHKMLGLHSQTASIDDLEKGLNELEELARDKKIFGIKLYPGYQIFDCADKNIFPIYELARKYNLPVKFHTGELHHCCPGENRKKGEFRCGSYCRIDK